ncbi:MAG TPA: phosphoribosyltransferase [Drouetiella sp.]
MIFKNRTDAGKALASRLSEFANRADTLLLALPRGGVPVAAEIARKLHMAMDVFIVRKLGAPEQEELAMGAIASGGIRVINPGIVRSLGVSQRVIDEIASQEQIELERRERSYRPNSQPHAITGMNVILVDDGLATGASMRAAIRAVKTKKPKHVYIAVPVGEIDVVKDLRKDVDDIFCAETPTPFKGVGQWYDDFAQTTDDEVKSLLSINFCAPYSIPSLENYFHH